MQPVDASISPAPDLIRETAREILARPDYHLKPLAEEDFAPLRQLLKLLGWLLSPFLGLFHKLYAVSPILAFGYAIGLVLILAALIWHIAYSFRTALRGRMEDRLYQGAARRELQPAELEGHARLAAERQDYITAVRYLFQACLLRLELANDRKLRKSATNREYLRRFQDTPAYEPLHRFVDIIDSKWYGQGRCEQSDFVECQRAHAEILLLKGT